MLTEERVAAIAPEPAARASDPERPRVRSRAAVVFPLLGLLLLVVFVLGIAVGSVPIPVVDVVKVLTGHEPHGVYHAIVSDIRLPRSITGLRKRVCSCSPATPRAAPTSTPVMERGSRMSETMAW